MASDDLRARLVEALAGLRFSLDAGRRYGLSGREVEEATEQLLPTVQSDLDRLHSACRSAAVLLRATADHRPDPATLLAAARDLDDVAGPEPTPPTTKE